MGIRGGASVTEAQMSTFDSTCVWETDNRPVVLGSPRASIDGVITFP